MGTTTWGRIAIVATIGALGALSGVVPCGATHVRSDAPPRASLDRPADARVRSDAVASLALDSFVRLDADADGAISRDEWRRLDAAGDPERDFEALDTNRDERISREEWSHAVGKTGLVLHLLPGPVPSRDEDATEGPAALLSLTF
jgi:hypothetical protein